MEISSKDQAIALIRRAKKILCVTREKTEGDGICAILALQKLLLKQKKEIYSVVPHGVNKNLMFLSEVEKIQTDLGENGDFVISISTEKNDVERVKYTIEEDFVDILVTPKSGNFTASDVTFRQNVGDFDLILVLDSPNLESLGSLFENHANLFSMVPIINISSNPANEYFGKVNLVEPQKSSTSEIVYDLISEIPAFSDFLDSDLATILLTGILSSTRSFLNNNSTAQSFEVASELQKIGARQSDIIENLFKKKSLQTLKIWGRIFGNLQVDPVHKIAWSNVTHSDFEIAESTPSDVDNVANNLLRFVQKVDLVGLLIEYPEKTLVQICSASPSIYFTELQKLFGGELIENGLEIEIYKKRVAEVEGDFLKALLRFQKEKLGIPESVDLQKMELVIKSDGFENQTNFSQVSDDFSEVVKPTPPAEIPFIAPFQPHESTGEIGSFNTEKKKEEAMVQSEPPGTQSAEVMIDPNNSAIPDWLRQKMPKGE